MTVPPTPASLESVLPAQMQMLVVALSAMDLLVQPMVTANLQLVSKEPAQPAITMLMDSTVMPSLALLTTTV